MANAINLLASTLHVTLKMALLSFNAIRCSDYIVLCKKNGNAIQCYKTYKHAEDEAKHFTDNGIKCNNTCTIQRNNLIESEA